MSGRPAAGPPTVAVWDPVVRLCHWGVVACVALAWVTAEGAPALHDGAGYMVLGLLAVRLLWGVVGTRHARFAGFVRRPGVVAAYARQLVTRQEPRYLGHNPLGGWMIVALIATAAGAAASGWLATTDAFWGVAWVEGLHEALANLLLALAGLHVAGVVVTSLRHRENLVASMVHGRKRPLGGA